MTKFIIVSILCLTVTLGVAWGAEEKYYPEGEAVKLPYYQIPPVNPPMFATEGDTVADIERQKLRGEVQKILAEEQKQTKLLEDIKAIMEEANKR
jgi:hypothetical protein